MADPRTHDPQLSMEGMTAVIWIETSAAVICVAIRLCLRFANRDRLTCDDGLVLLALLCMITMNALLTPVLPAIYILGGLVVGTIAEPPADLEEIATRYLKHQFAAIILFWTTVWSVKGSFLAFYKQLFGRKYGGWQKGAWWLVAGFCATTFVANVVLQFFACDPLRTYFELGSCATAKDIEISNSSLYLQTGTDIACDILIMVLPLSILRQLRMKLATKVALGALFGAGAIIVVFALLRLFFTLPGANSQVNPEWLAVWSSTEAMVAVGVSCTLAFRKYFTAGGLPAEGVRIHGSGGSGGKPARLQFEEGGIGLMGHSHRSSSSEQYKADRTDLGS